MKVETGDKGVKVEAPNGSRAAEGQDRVEVIFDVAFVGLRFALEPPPARARNGKQVVSAGVAHLHDLFHIVDDQLHALPRPTANHSRSWRRRLRSRLP